jgi:hypothetical protein
MGGDAERIGGGQTEAGVAVIDGEDGMVVGDRVSVVSAGTSDNQESVWRASSPGIPSARRSETSN